MAQETAKEQVQVEEQTNCPACNKVLKKIKRYYRNGKYYCTKKCWSKATKAKTEDKEEK